jgi:hypothetical protein
MQTYIVRDKDGNTLADGIQEREASQVAQRIANRLGESVWLSASDSQDRREEFEPTTLAMAMQKVAEALNLQDLLIALQKYVNLIGEASHAEEPIDLSSLPKFGGERPLKYLEVWSWDDKHVLVGSGKGPFPTDWRIVNRDDWEKIAG